MIDRILKFACMTIIWTGTTTFVSAQDSTQVETNTTNLIKVYIDSPDWYMDLDYFRTEIPYVDYVRDRADADVQILTTTQSTGGDGYKFTINFIGLRSYNDQQNKLTLTTNQSDSEVIIRKELARHFRIGLLPFVSHSSTLKYIDVKYQNHEPENNSVREKDDPWNSWTFRTSLQTYINGENDYSGSFGQ